MTHPCIVGKFRQTISWKKEEVFLEKKKLISLSFVAPFSFIVERVVCQTIL